MSYTNTTSHYSLPQYVATDKPKYLTDFNETMDAIDTQMYTNAQAAATADGKAVAAQGTADGAVSSIGTLNTQINGDPTDPSDTGLAGEVSGIDTELNTVQSLIGSGTPTTSNQTIIGAINGLEGAIAPREDGDDLANSYAEGEQFARGGSVYEALTSLTAGTAFASLTLNTDYKVSDTLVEQIASVIDAKLDKTALSDLGLYKEVKNIATVSADGVKTLQALLVELATACNTYFTEHADEYVMPVTLFITGYGVLTADTASVRTSGGTIGNTFKQMAIGTTSMGMKSVSVNTTTPHSNTGDVDSGGYTYANHDSDVPTSGDTLIVGAMIFKKM